MIAEEALVCRECGAPATCYLGKPANKAKHAYCRECGRQVSYNSQPHCLACDGILRHPRSKRERPDRSYCRCGEER